MTGVSIVVPTYREAESLPHLIERVARLRAESGLDVELLVMDDDSRDGTVELMETRAEPWVQLVVRSGKRGLSPAVIDGLRRAAKEFLVVMDADLSHPPERVPAMIEALRGGFDFAVGSRYVEGGTTADDWGFLRWLNSRIATALARPFTSIQDPMSGFFAMHRSTFERAEALDPVGYKIALELIVKCRCQRVGEVPIHFENRRYGESKLTFREQLRYLQHLRRLGVHRFGAWPPLARFLAVGAVGTAVNLAVLTGLLRLGLGAPLALAGGIAISMLGNLALTGRLSSYGPAEGPLARRLFEFGRSSGLGALVNFAVSLATLRVAPRLPVQGAALVGIALGGIVNFSANRFQAFRERHVRPG
jgi:dolichol-phosphate mannosyltransferase